MAGLASAAADLTYLFGRPVGDLLLGWRSGEGSRPPSALLCEHEDTPRCPLRCRTGKCTTERSGHQRRGPHSLQMLTPKDYNEDKLSLQGATTSAKSACTVSAYAEGRSGSCGRAIES